MAFKYNNLLLPRLHLLMRKTDADIKIPAYQVTLNTAAFQSKKPILKQRLHRQYLHAYWKKFKMDQKKIVPNSEDRLSQLTISQIDRIIANEKLQALLYNNKQKIAPVQFNLDTIQPNRHYNIYQANFIAKINQIAIKRDIHYIPSEGMEEVGPKKIVKHLPSQSKKPLKYGKEYITDENARKIKTLNNEDDQVKSIESFQGNLEEFQIKLDFLKQSQLFNNQNVGPSKKQKSYKLIPENRWFHGMSTAVFQPKKKQSQSNTTKLNETWKHSYDIQSQNYERPTTQSKKSSFSAITVKNEKSQSSYPRNQSQPFEKYRSKRIVTIN